MSKKIFNIIISICLLSFSSCEKTFITDSRFIGAWKIVSSKYDTIFFANDSSFTRKYSDGLYHTFEYSYNKKTISIQYKGPNSIFVLPTTHIYELRENVLTIDFTNGCYGFDKEIFTLTKLE